MKKIFLLIVILGCFFDCVNAQNIKKKQVNLDCDTTANDIFTIVEVMPKYDSDSKQIEKLITESLDPAYIQKVVNSSYYISLGVDCMGNTFRYTVLRTADTLISNKILSTLKTNSKWTSGKQRGNPVNCIINLKFEIKNGSLKWVTQRN